MKNKHRNNLFYWILIPAVITWIIYRYASTRRGQREFTEVTCILPDGSLIPINPDSVYLSDLYGKVPSKMLDTLRDSNATARIIVPPACRFKLMFNFYSAVFLNERSTFYIPLKGDLYHTMGVKGEAFFILKEEDTSSFYRIAGPYASVGCGQGNLYIKTSEDSSTVAMLTARGQITTPAGDFPYFGPGQGVNMSKRVPPKNWNIGPVDSSYCPNFVVEVVRFNNDPFVEVVSFLEDYFHLEVAVENEYLGFQPVTFSVEPRKLSLEGVCEVIKNATGYEYEISKGKVTFLLKRFM